MSYLFEQAGKQLSLSEAGYWLATAPKEELEQMVKANPDIMNDWDDEVGDRITKLVFIGQNMDKEKIKKDLKDCEWFFEMGTVQMEKKQSFREKYWK